MTSTTMKITPKEALQRTIEHREIFYDEMVDLMRQIMTGEVSPVMMAALITGLRVKKETVDEITAAAQVMRDFATKVEIADKTHLVDIVGTGGDGSNTFNISTCALFVIAAAGGRVPFRRSPCLASSLMPAVAGCLAEQDDPLSAPRRE